MYRTPAPKALGLCARPVMVMVFDLDEKHQPMGALYLDSNANLYVLCDPGVEKVGFVLVSSSRVGPVDQVTYRSP